MEKSNHPLGSKENPIKCDGPQGERNYLEKLVTQEGRAIKTSRKGSTSNTSGSIVDVYPIEDENGQIITTLYFDMYHKGYKEKKVPAPYLISAAEQIVHQLAGSHPSNPLIVENQKTLSDLLKTFHFNQDLPDNILNNEVCRIHTYHVMDKSELELFALIKEQKIS